MHFADATCRELTAVLLQIAAQACGPTANRGDVPARLQAIADRDAEFAQWCQQHLSSTHAATDPDWSFVACRLATWLTAESSTARSDSSADDELHSAAHVVLRLQTLETAFATELEQRKTEAIYHFAYGLSHELNNPLANIATRAGVLASQEDSPERRRLLQTMVDSALRGGAMLGDLMLVARPPRLEPVSTPVRAFAEGFAQLARPWIADRQIELVVDCRTEASVAIDEAAFREACWCLLRNAVEAMPAGGRVEWMLADAKRQVCCRMSDRGQGLSPEALAHCFEPYYSGREAGRGLGLGLSKAKRIVELHAGRIRIDNRPGGGCTVEIELPELIE